jgi:hypothetical protein
MIPGGKVATTAGKVVSKVIKGADKAADIIKAEEKARKAAEEAARLKKLEEEAKTAKAAEGSGGGYIQQRVLTASEQRAINSYEKRIAEHKAKLEEFRANPTVRPGMEGLPEEVIQKQQAARINHLETEIKTFQDNIDKIRGK